MGLSAARGADFILLADFLITEYLLRVGEPLFIMALVGEPLIVPPLEADPFESMLPLADKSERLGTPSGEAIVGREGDIRRRR